MKRLIASLAVAVALGVPCAAQADSSILPDYSDLWYNPAESGWGAHITLQNDIIFLVLYVYDGQRQPRFFVSSDMRRPEGSQSFTGVLFNTEGPYFGGPANARPVVNHTVGNATLTFNSVGKATLAYTINGVMVTKSIQRIGFAAPNLTGDYRGGMWSNATAQTCAFNLPAVNYPGTVKISQSGDQVTIDSIFQPGVAESGVCKWQGRLSQLGTVVSIEQGTYECDFFNEPNHYSGTFSLTGIEANEAGFSGKYTALQGAACIHDGFMGGYRRGYSDTPPEVAGPDQQ